MHQVHWLIVIVTWVVALQHSMVRLAPFSCLVEGGAIALQLWRAMATTEGSNAWPTNKQIPWPSKHLLVMIYMYGVLSLCLIDQWIGLGQCCLGPGAGFPRSSCCSSSICIPPGVLLWRIRQWRGPPIPNFANSIERIHQLKSSESEVVSSIKAAHLEREIADRKSILLPSLSCPWMCLSACFLLMSYWKIANAQKTPFVELLRHQEKIEELEHDTCPITRGFLP